MNDVTLKTKASTDLPGFVRDDYATFVTFIDAYHEWLDINQANIKTLTDIDTTLESFIVNFRKEVDYRGIKFPHIDERFLIRHIKQLYLSKGTEESYKLLFRLLFNKDIIIKYPDQMTLKLSDGKWTQLTSIFVEVQAGDATTLDDKVVKITTALPLQAKNVTVEKAKLRRTGGSVSTISLLSGGTGYTSPTITLSGSGSGAAAHAVVDGGVITAILIDNPGTSYLTPPTITIVGANTTPAIISSVQMFVMPDIYELNISKHYYGNILIGDVVTLGTFVGKVMPTINTTTIVDPGKNFRLGQTFDVDTMFGRGATVKVTKLVPITYGIGELKFIEFGFGYVSDFESSNIIPPNISTTRPLEGFSGLSGTFHEYAVADPSGGYVLNDTYSMSDPDVNVITNTSTQATHHSPITASYVLTDSWTSTGEITISTGALTIDGVLTLTHVVNDAGLYATDFAGEVVREFYSSNQYNGDVANAARIQFKIGAVCKYPGYYASSDGMPSDINKIQDSFLYQKYSYIVQTDEKLDTYRDIVKSFIHPAGMALFGEFSLNNDFNTPITLTSLLSIFAVNHADVVSFTESEKSYLLGKTINDASTTLLGIAQDHAVPGDTKIWTLQTAITDPVDYVTASNDGTTPGVNTTNFTGFKYDSVSNIDGGPLFTTEYNLSESVDPNSIEFPDYASIYMDGFRLFSTLNEPIDINSYSISKIMPASDIDDYVFIDEVGTVTLNLYMDQMGEYVIGDYMSAPDSTFTTLSEFGTITIGAPLTSSGMILLGPNSIVTINDVWTIN